MVFEVSSALLHFLVKELKALENGKVEKIYQLGKETIIIRFYKEGKKINLRITLPGIICLSTQEFDAPTLPPGFCMFLRKYLSSARLLTLEQKEFERILVMKFVRGEEEFFLIVELFKPGNIILCKEEKESLQIVNCLERQRFKDRTVQARAEYKFPPLLINPLKIKKQELISLIEDSDRNLVKTLAAKLGLGGVYAEELLARANINKDKESITEEEAEKFLVTTKKFFEEKPSPVKSESNVYPIPLITKEGTKVNSISEALDSSLPFKKKQEKSEVVEKKKDKTSSLVDIQEKMIKNLEEKAKENQEKGEYIYSNYQDFKKLIDEANKIRKEKGLDALEKEMKNNPKFKSLNKKDKEITLKF